MEDARFVQVIDPDGRPAYQATYTAYDGFNISGRVIYTRDLRHFEVTALHGPAARNKGMALFPRYINGKKIDLRKFSTSDTISPFAKAAMASSIRWWPRFRFRCAH